MSKTSASRPRHPRGGANRSPASTSRPDATFSARRPAFGPPSPITGEDTTSRAAQGTSGGTARATPRSQLLEADRIAEVEPEEILVHRFSVRLRIRVHEVVQRRARLRPGQPAGPPPPPAPPVPGRVPPRPAVLRFRHVAFGSLRQADAEHFAGRDSRGPRQGHKYGVEVRAVSPEGGQQHPPLPQPTTLGV